MSRKRKHEEKAPQDLDILQFLEGINSHMSSPDNGFENSEPVKQLLLSLRYVPSEWAKYTFFSTEHYTRNLVATKDFTYDLILLCWQPGQKSSVHDHRESGCWMRMLTGTLTETRYKVAEAQLNGSDCKDGDDGYASKEDHLEQISECTYREGQVFYINNDLGLHGVSNPGKEPAISLHLYSPPIMDCEVWLETGPQIFKTSLHSVFGMKLPQHMFKPKPTNPLGGKYWPLAIHRKDRQVESHSPPNQSNGYSAKKQKSDDDRLEVITAAPS